MLCKSRSLIVIEKTVRNTYSFLFEISDLSFLITHILGIFLVLIAEMLNWFHNAINMSLNFKQFWTKNYVEMFLLTGSINKFDIINQSETFRASLHSTDDTRICNNLTAIWPGLGAHIIQRRRFFRLVQISYLLKCWIPLFPRIH